MKEIGNRIKKIRTSKGIEAKDFAFSIGVNHTSLAKIEREGTNSVERLLIIAKVLKVNVSDFFEDKTLANSKDPKSEYGPVTKDEINSLAHRLDLISEKVDKLINELKNKKTVPVKKKIAKK